MVRIQHLLVASTLLGAVQVASAQGAEAGSPPTVIFVAPTLAPPGEGNAATTSGAPAQAGQQQAQPPSPGLAVGTIMQTRPPSDIGVTAAELSRDPLILRREARARARQEYRARVEAAKREYREDLRAADALAIRQGQSGY